MTVDGEALPAEHLQPGVYFVKLPKRAIAHMEVLRRQLLEFQGQNPDVRFIVLGDDIELQPATLADFDEAVHRSLRRLGLAV